MRIIKLFGVVLALNFMGLTVAEAALIRTSDGATITNSDLPFTTDTVLSVENGQLTGAFNVDVVGQGIFDVVFDDRSFNDITNFNVVATVSNINDFASSLLDNVFVNVGNFLFDSIPSLTSGCENSSVCFAFIPKEISANGRVLTLGAARNQSLASSQPDVAVEDQGLFLTDRDLVGANAAVFANFFAAPTRIAPPLIITPVNLPGVVQDVPEPSNILWLLVAFVGASYYYRKRRMNLPA